MSRKDKFAQKGDQAASRTGFFHHAWVAPTTLVILTALVYARSLAVPIHDSDDYVYYFRDARLEHISLDTLWRILTQPFFANFHPLTTLTYAFDRVVWGTWVPGFHITQVTLYAGGVLGLYFLFARILGRRGAAFAAAAIYATHTVHVESVAWLASRKDVVCLFFYAFALLAYVRYAGSPKGGWGPYALSWALAGAAMLSKGYAVILPAAFFAYDLCFSERITRRHILDKVPFLALTAAATLLTINAQDRDSALVQSALTGEERAGLLTEILARYVGHTLLPIRLSAVYTVGYEPVVGAVALLGGLLAVALIAGFIVLRRRLPAASFGIALYVLPLATVMNLFFTLRIWMTDRYLFFPTIGSSLAIVAIATSLFRRGSPALAGLRARTVRRGLGVMAALAIGLYASLTVARIGVWTSGVSLWSDALRKQLNLRGSGHLTADELAGVPKGRLIDSGPLIGLMRSYEAVGNRAESERISKVLGQTPGRGDEHGEMALARQELDAGRPEEVLRRLKPIAEGKTWLAPLALIWIGVAEDRMGNLEASRRTLGRAIDLYRETGQPATDALLDVGTVEFGKGNFAKAAEWYRLAHQESPREAKAAFHLGRAFEESGNVPEALRLYKRIADGELAILPQSQFTILDVTLQLAIATQKVGRPNEAIGYFEEVLRREPNHPMRESILTQIASLRAAPTP